jgi:hypothetical protein
MTHRTLRLSSTLFVAGLLSLSAGAAHVAGASVTFGTPTAQSTFGTGIDFTQPVNGTFVEADFVIEMPGSIGPSIEALTGQGSGDLTYSLDTSNGGMLPNTPVDAHFRVVFADGTFQDGPNIHIVYADDRFSWKSVSGSLVTIHWFEGSDSFAQTLLSYAQNGIEHSADYLGVTETKRVDFFVYPSQEAFAGGINAKETIGGQADPSFRTCFALIATTDLSYAQTVIPHELTHIVFSDMTDNPYHSPPRWLGEGLAVYLAEGYGSYNRSLVSSAGNDGTLVPLQALAGYFALDEARIFLSYAEATSAVDFMVRTYGQTAVRTLLSTYATGASDDEAFQAAFGIDMMAFDAAWLADNGVNASATFGPLPAPTGALPPGWSTSGSQGTVTTAEPTAAGSQTGPSSGNESGGDRWPFLILVVGLMAAAGAILLLTGIILARQKK